MARCLLVLVFVLILILVLLLAFVLVFVLCKKVRILQVKYLTKERLFDTNLNY